MDRRTFLKLSGFGALSVPVSGLLLPAKASAAGSGDWKAAVFVELLGGCDNALFAIPASGSVLDHLQSIRGTSLYDPSSGFELGNGTNTMMHPALAALEPYVANLRLTLNGANALHVGTTRSHEQAQNRMTLGAVPSDTGSVGWKARVYDNAQNANLMGFTSSRSMNFNCESQRCRNTPPLVVEDYESYNLDTTTLNSNFGGSSNTAYVANIIERMSKVNVARDLVALEQQYRLGLASTLNAIEDVETTIAYSTPKYSDYEVGSDYYNSFARRFRNIASTLLRMQTEGSSDKIIFTIGLGSFDFHSDWTNRAQTMMGMLGGVLRTFFDDLTAMGMFDRVVVSTETDFGRQVHTNGEGTDHGSGIHTLTLGGGVNGGGSAVWGEPLTVAHMQSHDAWPTLVDTRSVIADILEYHLGLDPYATAFPGVLGSQFSRPAMQLFSQDTPA